MLSICILYHFTFDLGSVLEQLWCYVLFLTTMMVVLIDASETNLIWENQMGKNNSRVSVSSQFAFLFADKLYNSALFVTVRPSILFSMLPAVLLFRPTHLSLQQALTAELAFSC